MKILTKMLGQSSIEELLSIFCTNMFKEAQEIAENFYPTNDRDLFMENSKSHNVLTYSSHSIIFY